MKLRHLRGLPPEHLQPKQSSCGAALSVGCKDRTRGFPINKDRFYVVETETQELAKGKTRKYAIEYRPPDPRFEPYHKLGIDQRRKFYGMVPFHHEPEFFDYGLLKYRGPTGRPDVINPQHRGPWCHGDGQIAERWNGSDYEEVRVCGAGCPFYDKHEPRMTVYFFPRWPDFLGPWTQDMERPLMKLASRGQLARDTFAGMLQDVRRVAEPLEIEISSWFGLPFTVSLGERTNPKERHRYPVLSFSLDGDPLKWLRWQQQQFQKVLSAGPTRLALGAASDAEREAEEVGRDARMISGQPARKPADDVIEAEEVKPAPEPEPEDAGRPIGEQGAKKLEAYVNEMRLAAVPRAIPPGLTAVISESGAGTTAAADLTEKQSKAVRAWVKDRAEKMPRG